jgi:hypothetical protein
MGPVFNQHFFSKETRMDVKKVIRFLGIAVVLVLGSTAVNAGDWQPGENVPLFRVVPLEDTIGRLEQDADVLGIPVVTLHQTEGTGKAILENENFFLSRREGTGYFVFFAKNVDWASAERGKEGVQPRELETRAITLLSKLGVKSSEVGDVYTRRAVMQSENAAGEDVGPPETNHFMVVVTRQLENTRVFGASARFYFSTTGELVKAQIEWRSVIRETATVETVKAGAGLRQANRQRIIGEGEERALRIAGEGFAFVEKPFDEVQETFELQFFTEYNFGGKRKIVFCDAAE